MTAADETVMGVASVKPPANLELGAVAAADAGEAGGVAAGPVCAPETTRAGALAALLADAVQPFVGADFEGRVTCLNRAFAELVGRAADAILGRPLAEITPEAMRPGLDRVLAKVKANAEPLRFEGGCLRPDGTTVPIAVAVEPDRDPAGAAVGLAAFVTDLSARVRAESALRESEERFRKLYDDAPVGYHEVDADGRFLSINRTECELLGYDREELLGRTVFDLVTESQRDAARAAFAEKVAGARPLGTFERTVVARDGRNLVVEVEDRYKRDADGRVVGILSTVQDVTERKRTEATLAATERKARALFTGIDEAVFVHAIDGRILEANPAASRLLGYSRAELLSLTTADIDDPAFAAGYEERLARQVATGHLACEGRHRTKDGRVIPVEINTTAVDFDGEKAVLALIRDISQRVALEDAQRALAESQAKSAEALAAKNAELTSSEARYRQLTEASIDGVIVIDRSGTVRLFNPAAERMFGYGPGEVVGKPVETLMPDGFRGAHHEGVDRYASTGRSKIVGKTVELTARRKNGEDFPIELSLAAVRIGEELQFIGSVRDQTERQRMRAMLARSEKLASIGLLSAGVAHEINNPLAYVGNNVAVLERDLASLVQMVEAYESARPALAASDPEALARAEAIAEEFDWAYVRENLPKMLSRTREGVQRVATIVGNLRGLARTTPPRMEPSNVADLVDNALEMVRGRLRRHKIELTVEHGTLPPLVCVPTQISQVVLNLAVNASQAVEMSGRAEGGRVDVATSLTADGGSVAIAVSDNGGGIDPEALPKLFDPFFTTKSVGEGTGLGLSICHGIVTGHGGRIEVESRPGTGATFRVCLPVRPGWEPQPTPPGGPTPP